MGVAKYTIEGSDYVGVFATATESNIFLGITLKERIKSYALQALKVEPIGISIFGTSLIGLFMRANSNGAVITNLIESHELAALKAQKKDLNIEIIESNLNAIGNNILCNDKIAIVNPEYESDSIRRIRDALGVEVVKDEIGGFKTVGANNILTNKGLVVNNRTTDIEKERIDKIVGFDSIRTTANTGSLNVGLSAIANTKGIIVGENTTGYELNRIIEALEIKD